MHSEDAYLYEEVKLRLLSINTLRGELGFLPHVGEWVVSLFPWLLFSASIQFGLSYIKSNNKQMDFANVRSENIVRRNNHR